MQSSEGVARNPAPILGFQPVLCISPARVADSIHAGGLSRKRVLMVSGAQFVHCRDQRSDILRRGVLGDAMTKVKYMAGALAIAR